MAEAPVKPLRCLGCGARAAGGADARGGGCPRCGGRRIADHPELDDLAVAHVDCDAFYASVEKRDRPELADRPVIVGGGRRGVVTTACYVARTYGVRSAMPMFKALAACPDAVVVKPDFDKYRVASRAIRERMLALTPLVEPLSIDEAFLDLAGTRRLHGAPPAMLLARLQAEVEREVGVTLSVGLSHNKFLAKLASDLDKPRGFSVIGRAETLAVLAPMPVTAIWGVGRVTAEALAREGYRTIGDLQKADRAVLARRHGELGLRLARLAHGEDARRVEPEHEARSVSAETTFEADLAALADLEAELWPLCEKVAGRMRDGALAGRVATLKLKTGDFRILTRRTTLAAPSGLAGALFDALRPMLRDMADGRRFRLIGAGYSDLAPALPSAQGALFAADDHRAARKEDAVHAIRERFGADAIRTGPKGSPTSSRRLPPAGGDEKKKA